MDKFDILRRFKKIFQVALTGSDCTCLSCNSEDGAVDLQIKEYKEEDFKIINGVKSVYGLARGQDSVEWTPHKNDDGSWSFKSFYGRWLSIDRDEGTTIREEQRGRFKLDSNPSCRHGKRIDEIEDTWEPQWVCHVIL